MSLSPSHPWLPLGGSGGVVVAWWAWPAAAAWQSGSAMPLPKRGVGWSGRVCAMSYGDRPETARHAMPVRLSWIVVFISRKTPVDRIGLFEQLEQGFHLSD